MQFIERKSFFFPIKYNNFNSALPLLVRRPFNSSPSPDVRPSQRLLFAPTPRARSIEALHLIIFRFNPIIRRRHPLACRHLVIIIIIYIIIYLSTYNKYLVKVVVSVSLPPLLLLVFDFIIFLIIISINIYFWRNSMAI